MQFCKIADAADWSRPDFEEIGSLLALESAGRKNWEYVQVYAGLKALGLLNGQTRALGLGVGSECLVYAFTNVCEQVVATDLYNSQNWSTASMAVEEVYHKNLFPYRPEHLAVQHMDMTQIEFPDASFDFIWSCCSIEHVNSFADLHRVYQEIHRVLKPGGIAALTTEYNLSPHHSYEPNMLFTDPYWIERWLTGPENTRPEALVQGLELLDLPQLTQTDLPENQPIPRRDPAMAIAYYSNDVIISSVAFFLRKTGDFTRSYSDDWLPSHHKTYLAGCAAQRQKHWPEAAALFRTLVTDSACEPQLRVAASRYLAVQFQEQQQQAELVELARQMRPLWQVSESTDHLLPIAHRYKRAGLWEEAKPLYDRVAILPGPRVSQVVRSWIGQAEYYAQHEDLPMALSLSQKAHDYLPFCFPKDYPEVYFHRGFYQERLGQLEAAMADYRFVIEAAETKPALRQNAQNRLEKCLSPIPPTEAAPGLSGGFKAMGRAVKGWFG
jgi:SAM-dependent methyltransferase